MVKNDAYPKESAALEKSILFLKEIGISVQFKKIDPKSFLPGLSIENGQLLVDKDKLEFPGDILHEAGHLAVVESGQRMILNAVMIENSENRAAEEMMAIGWSYAACLHLGLDPSFVFHENGYHGGGPNLVQNFENKQYIGLPMLQWIGLTVDEKNAAVLKIPAYPSMIKWLRD